MAVVVTEFYLPLFAAISLFALCALLRMPRFARHFLMGSAQDGSGQVFEPKPS